MYKLKIQVKTNGQWSKLHEKVSWLLFMTWAQKNCTVSINVPDLKESFITNPASRSFTPSQAYSHFHLVSLLGIIPFRS